MRAASRLTFHQCQRSTLGSRRKHDTPSARFSFSGLPGHRYRERGRPALRTLPEFEVVAVSARRKESAQQAAEKFGIPDAYDDAHDLIKDPDVDLVAVLTPTSQRVPLVKAAIEASKDVYSEWPLTTRTADSEELLALAEAKGVRHVVGLQRRQGPAARYARDLVAQGYVGDVRAARISVGVDAFPPVMPERVAWTFDVDAFTHVLSIYGGHFLDVLFQIVGPPKDLTAITETQFPELTVLETGKTVPSAKPDEVMAIGTVLPVSPGRLARRERAGPGPPIRRVCPRQGQRHQRGDHVRRRRTAASPDRPDPAVVRAVLGIEMGAPHRLGGPPRATCGSPTRTPHCYTGHSDAAVTQGRQPGRRAGHDRPGPLRRLATRRWRCFALKSLR
ncbi:Gfo/Idh/MocA family protein [Streptomyces sp. NPDC004270]